MSIREIKYPSAVEPIKWGNEHAIAVQMIAEGRANEGQQKLFLQWLIESACGTYDLDYRPDPRDHAFTSGRRFVGLEVLKILKIKLSVMQKPNS